MEGIKNLRNNFLNFKMIWNYTKEYCHISNLIKKIFIVNITQTPSTINVAELRLTLIRQTLFSVPMVQLNRVPQNKPF